MRTTRSIFLVIVSVPLVLSVFSLRVWTLDNPPENHAAVAPSVDHAAIIRSWDEASFQRGKQIYVDNCARCHGADGQDPPNANATAFVRDSLKNGNDPYSMWKTLTEGFKLMPAQTWLSPKQRYDVIHYIRESFFKSSNPSQYTSITEAYLAGLPGPSKAQEKEEQQEERQQDYGPALAYELGATRSALILSLTDSVSLSYDLHTVSIPAVWTGGGVELSGTHHTEYKGNKRARIAGKKLGFGPLKWAYSGSFEDPRRGTEKLGPMPEEAIEYLGYYLYGDRVVLSYRVSGRDVLDMPGVRTSGGAPVLTHTLRVGAGEALTLSLGRRKDAERAYRKTLDGAQATAAGPAQNHLLVAGTDTLVAVGVTGAGAASARWEMGKGGRLLLHLPARSEPGLFKVFRMVGSEPDALGRRLSRLVSSTETIADPAQRTDGGPGRWNRVLTTSGSVSNADSAYVLDRLGIPFDNPWGAWMRLSALDFFEDGRAAVATLNGDVWIVSGIDEDLNELKWQRYATGLYEPLGLKIKDGKIYVAGRDRITRLHDQNGDSEADFYESFFAFDYVSQGYHAFTFGLDTDSEGNFYTALSGRKTDYPIPGAVLRVAPDGGESEIVATGFRHPNGLAVGPRDRIFVSDQQGGWVPASKLSRVRKGGFYGYIGWDNRRPHGDFQQPAFWLPQAADNSSGGPLWVASNRWGPLSGRMLHTSYGAGRVFYTSLQEVKGGLQGAAVPFPWQFSSGVMRARVNPKDGQVYVIGLKGWGTRAQKNGALNRIRYTGRPAHLLMEVGTTSEGLRLQFSTPLKAAVATDASRYTIKRWNYKWTKSYGSPHYVPGSGYSQEGEEVVHPEAIRLSEDRRTVFLDFSVHRPVDQMKIAVDLEAKDGTLVQQTVYSTVK